MFAKGNLAVVSMHRTDKTSVSRFLLLWWGWTVHVLLQRKLSRCPAQRTGSPNTVTARHYETTSKRDEKEIAILPPAPPAPLQRHLQGPERPCLPQELDRGRGGRPAQLQPPVGTFTGSRSGVRPRRALERMRSDIINLLGRPRSERSRKGAPATCHSPSMLPEKTHPSHCLKGSILFVSVCSILSPLTSWPFCRKTFIAIIVRCGNRAMPLHWGPICSPRDIWQRLEPFVLSRLRGEVLLHLESRGQNCHLPPLQCTGEPPRVKNYLTQLSLVLRSRWTKRRKSQLKNSCRRNPRRSPVAP